MRINKRLTLAFLLISLVSLTVTSVVSYLIAKDALTRRVLNQLESVAAIQRGRIESLIDQDFERLGLIANRTELRAGLQRYLKAPNIDDQAGMNRILLDARTTMGDAQEISILSPEGMVVASTSDAIVDTQHADEEYFIRGRTGNSADVLPIDADEMNLYVSGPILADNKLVGVIVMKCDVNKILVIAKTCPGLGATGETLLVKKDKNGNAVFLTALSFDQYAAMNRTVYRENLSVPVSQALNRKVRLFTDAVDYDGEPILAATQYIERNGWGLVVKKEKWEAFAPILHLRNVLVLAILFSSMIVVLASLWVSHSITAPIVRLTEAASKISGGDLSLKVEAGSADEVGALAQAFNQMTEKLIESNASLEQRVSERTSELGREILERKQVEQALAAANRELMLARAGLEARVDASAAELAAANRDLETLLYVMSHDLKEPLRAIENFAGLVNERYANQLDEKGRDFLFRVTRGADRLQRLLDDILLLSRARRVSPPAEAIEGETVVREALTRLETRIKETRADVRVEEGLPRLHVDKTWATEAVYNLVANALKFTTNGEAPQVEIAPYRGKADNGARVGIAVRDRGPGVLPDQAERIFQLFQRGVSREVEGTGAGLAIVRQIAERHGGSAWFQPREGGGSEFIITFGAGDATGRTTRMGGMN